jgi:hypothetical protein
MARKCKCKICGTNLTTDIAYKVNKSYYCNEVEYSQYHQENVAYKKIIDNINYILGYISTNTSIFKEIQKLKIAYTYTHINNYLETERDNIINYISRKDFNNEYNKIRYIFTIISNNLADFIEIKPQETELVSIIQNEQDLDIKDNWKSTANTNFLDII